jgi:hypothetical protein
MVTKLDLRKLYGVHYDDIVACGKAAFIERQTVELQKQLDEIKKSLPWYIRVLMRLMARKA